jgi:hypothetical protein
MDVRTHEPESSTSFSRGLSYMSSRNSHGLSLLALPLTSLSIVLVVPTEQPSPERWAIDCEPKESPQEHHQSYPPAPSPVGHWDGCLSPWAVRCPPPEPQVPQTHAEISFEAPQKEVCAPVLGLYSACFWGTT